MKINSQNRVSINHIKPLLDVLNTSTNPTSVPSTPSRLLLEHFHPVFTMHLYHLNPYRQLRIAQLRANSLLVFQPSITLQPTDAHLVIPLTSNSILKWKSDHTLKLNRHTFRFYTPDQATHFHSAVNHAINSIRRPSPSYSPSSPLTTTSSTTVQFAIHPSLHHPVVVKSVQKHEAFLSETRLTHLVSERTALARAAACRSTFIVRLIDAFETKDRLHLVTELAALGDLQSFLRHLPKRRLPQPTARLIFAELILALAELHGLGLLYRDMNPSNILLSSTGHVRLAGLGLSKHVLDPQASSSTMSLSRVTSFSSDASGVPSSPFTPCEMAQIRTQSFKSRTSIESSSSTCTLSDITSDLENEACSNNTSYSLPSTNKPSTPLARAKSFVGMRHYMSPEHLGAGHGGHGSYGSKADVWALGVTLFEMLTGRHPFARAIRTGDATALFSAIDEAHVEMPTWLGAEVTDLLRGMLEKDEEQRLDIEGIMEHEWLNDIEWVEIERAASRDEPVVEMVHLAEKFGIERIDERENENMMSFRISDCDTLSRDSDCESTRSSCRERCPEKKFAGNEQLLGFGFFLSK